MYLQSELFLKVSMFHYLPTPTSLFCQQSTPNFQGWRGPLYKDTALSTHPEEDQARKRVEQTPGAQSCSAGNIAQL